MSQITLLTGPERRRRWADEERLKILSEAFSPGACVSEVARRHDVSTALIYGWRRKFRQELPAPAPSTLLATGPSTMLGTSPSATLGTGFAEAVVVGEPDSAVPNMGAAIFIDLPGGRRVSMAAATPPALAAAVLKALR